MKKMTKRLASLVLALVLACCALPGVTYGATTSVDLNQNYLFRARTNAFSFGTGETANLTFTPQYTAKYTLKLYGHVTGGRNIRASLTNPNGAVTDFEYPNRTGSTVKDYSHPYLTATLEQGKTYTYSVRGWTATSTGATVDVDFTSGESGTLSQEVGLRLYLDQTEFTTYSQQAVLNAMKLLIVDRTGAHLEWKYKDAMGSLLVDSAADVKIPTPPAYTGYTFVGWSYTPTQIHSSTTSLTVQALYRAGGAKQLTITAPGCTLQCGSQTARNSLNVAYGARVTVSAADAKGFSADGRVLGYGSRYSFYVVADLALEKRTDDLTPVPSVSLLSAQLQSDTGRVMFAATRSMAGEGNRLVTSGFLYGKNLTDDDLVLEMAGKPGTGTDAGTVRCAQNRSTEPEGQFVLYYGISSHVGTAAARAYLTYTDADGILHTVYSAVLRYTY